MGDSPARTIFVSYSHRDEAHKDRLLTHLRLLERQGLIAAWTDRQIMPAEEWEPAIEEHLEAADLIILLISADFLASDYCWSKELQRAMERHDAGQAQVLPIFVDHCDWKDAPFGKLQGLPKDAVPVTAYANSAEAWTQVATAIRRLAERWEGLPRRDRKMASPYIRWTDELRIYGEGLFAGRVAELKLLDRALAGGKTRVLSLWAEGGAGKTRLLVQWLNRIRDDDWRGLGSVFVHSFYSQGSSDDRNASSDPFFDQALAHFGYTGPIITDPSQKGRQLSQLVTAAGGLLVLDGLEPLQYPPHDARKGELKDNAIRALLLTLANASAGLCLVTTRQELPELKSRLGAAVAQQPLDRLSSDDGVALLHELEIKGPDQELRDAVEDYHGHAYSLMLLGTYLHDATDDHDIRQRHEFPLLDEDTDHDHHAQHIFETYERHLGPKRPEIAVLRLLGFFNRPAAHELIDVLRARGKDDLRDIVRPLLKLRQPQWQRVLTRLTDLRLLSVADDGALDSHPLLREYFAEQLRTQFPDAFQSGHRRLYEHLCATTEHQPDTLDGLQPLYQAVAHGCQAGLQQQACDDVYDDRILRGADAYSTFKLGAIGADLGAVACFFDRPWSRLSENLSESDQAWLLNEAAYSLRALGRLTEALEPMRAGLKMRIEQKEWKNAAISAENLSELELTLGEVSAAVDHADRGVEYADRSEEPAEMRDNRAAHADALHQAGRRDQARQLFAEAETMQAEDQPEYPRLYSLSGFQHCDLLLSEAERAAWQAQVRGSVPPSWMGRSPHAPDRLSPIEGAEGQQNGNAELQACDHVTRRAKQWIEWRVPNDSLLDIALIDLTLGRAALYRALLSQSAIPNLKSEIQTHLTAAVDGLRESGQVHELPRGLLSRAWHRHVTGNTTGATSDLDEAWEIAERGPMPLHMADILLTRARLFGGIRVESKGIKGGGGSSFAKASADKGWEVGGGGTGKHAGRIKGGGYPWGSPREDLAEARRLIEKHGYHRRDEELADAEEASKSWPKTTPAEPAPAREEVVDAAPTAEEARMNKTVVEFDLVGYSTICDNLEQALDVRTAAQLNQQIQGFIDAGLTGVSKTREETGATTTGDGAILVFDSAADSHRFAEAVHEATRVHNAARKQPLAKRVFRSGAATGEIVMDPKPGGGFEIAGMTIARAVRLEGQAEPGGLLVDEATYQALLANQQRLYGPKSRVPGKRDEEFDAYACQMNPDGPKDAAFFTDRAGSNREAMVPIAKEGAALEQLKLLPAAQIEQLIFRFDRGNVVPGRHAAQADRAVELLRVVRNQPHGFAMLWDDIQKLRGTTK